jgi:hypothetical protein
MTVAIKNKQPVSVSPAALRRAGFKSGQEIEIKVSGGMIMIVPKLTRDEVEDEREVRDPKIRAIIRQSNEDFLAGKTRPAEILQQELVKIAESQGAGGKSVSRRRSKA